MALLVDTHIVHQEPLDEIRTQLRIKIKKLNRKENQTSVENKCFMAETTPEDSPDALKDELDISPTFIEQGKNILIGLTVTPKLLYVIHRAKFEDCLFFHLILITVKSRGVERKIPLTPSMHVCFLFSLNNLNLCKKDVVR